MDLMIALVTIALIGYVFYIVFTSQDGGGCVAMNAARREAAEALRAAAAPKAEKTEAAAEAAAPKAEAQRVADTGAAAVKPAAPTPVKPPAPVETKPEPAPVARPSAANDLLRNPANGESAAVPANYRFAKKWIKEALVTEGLLNKVYKNNELDEAASKKVKAALEQLKTLAKYQA